MCERSTANSTDPGLARLCDENGNPVVEKLRVGNAGPDQLCPTMEIEKPTHTMHRANTGRSISEWCETGTTSSECESDRTGSEEAK